MTLVTLVTLNDSTMPGDIGDSGDTEAGEQCHQSNVTSVTNVTTPRAGGGPKRAKISSLKRIRVHEFEFVITHRKVIFPDTPQKVVTVVTFVGDTALPWRKSVGKGGGPMLSGEPRGRGW